jgi:hypothetical protein
VERKIKFTPTADEKFTELENSPANAALFEQVRKAIGYLEINPHHPSLHTHEFTSLSGASGEKVFEAYAQNNTPGAYRIFGATAQMKSRGKSEFQLSQSLRSLAIHSRQRSIDVQNRT